MILISKHSKLSACSKLLSTKQNIALNVCSYVPYANSGNAVLQTSSSRFLHDARRSVGLWKVKPWRAGQ